MSIVERSVRLVPMIGVMGTIFFLSHQPGIYFNILNVSFMDKVCHFLIYGLLGLTVIYGLSDAERSIRLPYLIAVAIAVSSLFGVSDEFHQTFIEGRFASRADIVADFTGAFFFCLIFGHHEILHRGLRLARISHH